MRITTFWGQGGGPVVFGGMSAIDAARQVDACIPNFIIQEFFPYHSPDLYELVKENFDTPAVDGFIKVPDRPGLGVEMNEEVLGQHECVRIEAG